MPSGQNVFNELMCCWPQSGIKQDTLNTLQTVPLNIATLFPDNVLKSRL